MFDGSDDGGRGGEETNGYVSAKILFRQKIKLFINSNFFFNYN